MIKFWYGGHVPSKSNTRMGSRQSDKDKRAAVKVYQVQIGTLAMKAKARAKRDGGGPFPLEGRRSVVLVGHGQSADPDNWFKATLDGMEGVCYLKDNQVVRGHWEVVEDASDHGLMVIVRWLD